MTDEELIAAVENEMTDYGSDAVAELVRRYRRLRNHGSLDVFLCRYCGKQVDFTKPYRSDEDGLWHWECGA